jgi:hypothetical protein
MKESVISDSSRVQQMLASRRRSDPELRSAAIFALHLDSTAQKRLNELRSIKSQSDDPTRPVAAGTLGHLISCDRYRRC